MKYKVFKGGRLAAQICSVIFWNQFRYPQPVRGVYDVAGKKMEKLKWAYKCWVHQLEAAEKGSGIEAYFAGQSLDFSLPENFVPKASLTMSAGGDLMAVDCLTYENTPQLFDGIRDFYFDADITCANLESTVYPKAPIGRNQVTAMPPKMNTTESMLDRFLDNGNGIDYFSTANNHCYDYKEEGLLATLDCLDRKHCCHSGTNRTEEEKEDVLIIEKKGIRIAMLSYTCDMNGNPYEKKHLINEVRFNDETVDLSLVERHIKRAREKKADLIVASVHWGWEFELYPHKSIIEAAHRMADMGIDVILGSHPHVSQPMERYQCDTKAGKRQSFITYSLGDFVSYHPLSRDSKLTYVVRFQVVKGLQDGKPAAVVTGLKVLPVYIMASEMKGGTEMPSSSSNRSECDAYDCRLLKFKEVLEDTKKGAPYHYPLEETDRKDVLRLDKVLHRILLPRNFKELLP